MRKTILWFALCLLTTMQLWAQSNAFKVQGIPRPDLTEGTQTHVGRSLRMQSSLFDDPYDYSKFTFDSIKFWVGSGSNRAALIIDWHDEKGVQTALVWGYRWHKDSIRTGFDMIKTIAKTDKRFLLLTHSTNLGNTIAGLGYDLNGIGKQSLIYDGQANQPIDPIAGVVSTTEYNYDNWTSSDPDDHWRAGWYKGYWSYQVKEEGDSEFEYSGWGASSRTLEDGSCDGWSYADMSGMTGTLPRMPFTATETALRISEIQIGEKQQTLAPSQQIQMSCSTVSEENIQPTLYWSTTDPAIASVDQDGRISALTVGTAQIIVTETNSRLADTCTITVEKMKYTEGVFFINEDWYGHNNSTINYLDKTGKWNYRVYQKENPGKELGATSQHGAIYGDKLFIVSKQAKDPGATITGSRLAVCNAETMECLAEFPTIGGSDGRSFTGVNEHKGYIGTSNGIYLFDIDNLTIGNKLQGTENSSGSLYAGQIGTMVQTHGKVFAVNQKKGLMVIDAQSDTIQTVIAAPKDGTKQRGFGSIVQSKDGNLWLSIATNTSGSGGGEEYLLKLNPQTLETTRIQLPKGISIPNSWYAWTADGFCSSTQHNKLYWKNNGGWFSSTKIFEYDIDKNDIRTVLDLSTDEPSMQWGIYGAGFRLDPRTDLIYASLFKSFGEPTYKVLKVNPNNEEVASSYPMESHYWFPAMPVFPDRYAPTISSDLAALTDLSISKTTAIFLGDKVTDTDNHDAAITKSVTILSNESILNVFVSNDSLFIKPVAKASGSADIALRFNSNGKTVTHTIRVTLSSTTSTDRTNVSAASIFPTITTGQITIRQGESPQEVHILNTSGQLLQSIRSRESEEKIDLSSLPSGIYVVKIGKEAFKVIKR